MADTTIKTILLEAGHLDALLKKGSPVAEREVTDLRKAFDAAVKKADAAHPSGMLAVDGPTQAIGGKRKGAVTGLTKRAQQCGTLLKRLEAHVSGDLEAKTGDKRQKMRGAENWQFKNIPPKRRLQTLCVSLFLFFTGVPFFITLTILLLLNWLTFPLMVAYIVYIFAVKQRHPVPKKKWWVQNGFWKLYRDYFPVRLVIPKHVRRTITPNRNYMFIYHPHGVHSFGAMINFGSEVNDVNKLLPGITIHCQTLGMNFYIPFWREMFIWGGSGDASASCIKKTLNAAPGESILLVVGGAEESLMSSPNTNDLTLSRRKGFVKIALQTGSPLVPVYAFGETNVYGNLAADSPKVQSFLKRLQKKIGFAIPLISGRGYFNYNFGILPHRRPIVTVVGEPLVVPKIEKPSAEEIDKYHREYVNALTALYNDHKFVYDSIGSPIRIM